MLCEGSLRKRMSCGITYVCYLFLKKGTNELIYKIEIVSDLENKEARGINWETGMDRSTLLLLLLSCFSRVRLCVTPQTAAHQAPPSLGSSRQEHWSGLPFPSPVRESEKCK